MKWQMMLIGLILGFCIVKTIKYYDHRCQKDEVIKESVKLGGAIYKYAIMECARNSNGKIITKKVDSIYKIELNKHLYKILK